MRFRKLFTRKTHPRRAPRANKFVLESLEPRLLLSAAPMTAAVVTTDHLDYAPGETAVITTANTNGDGLQFGVGELVRFQVSRTDGMADAAGQTANVGPTGNEAWYVTDGVGGFTAHLGSDVSGDGVADWIAPDNDNTINSSISTSWFVEEQYRNSSLLVTAQGQESGAVATQTFTDANINTTIVVSSSAPTSTYGDTVTLTATVTPATGTIRPVGSVQFFDGTTSLGTVSTASNGSGATSTFAITLSNLTAGSHAIHAVFTGGTVGADTFQNSTSGDIAQTVNKANATITVTGYDVDYDGIEHEATGLATGVLGEDLSAGLDLSLTAHTNAGGYDGPWTFDGGNNYNDAIGTVAVLIARVDATIVVNGFNAVYAATPPGPSGTPQGLFQDNSPPIPIRSYGTVLELTPTGITNNNSAGLGGLDGFRYVNQLYSADQDVTVTLAGAPATGSSHYLSVFMRVQNPDTGIVNAYYVTYEEAGATGNWYVGRLINDERVPVTVNNAGTHLANGDQIRATVVGNTITAYSLHGGVWTAEVSHTMTGLDVVSGPGYTGLLISGGSPEINLTNVTGVFGAAAHAATGTAVGIFGESLSGLNLNGTTHENAGTYSDTWTFTNRNYRSVSGTVTNTIAQADAAITVTGYNVIYDGAAHTATGTAVGVLGENLSAGLNLSSTSHTNAGSYSDAWTFSDSAGNYKSASGTVHSSIDAGTPSTTTTIASSAATSIYGNAVTFTATVTAVTGIAAPTGAVEFFDGATSLGIDSVANSTGAGTSTWSLTTAGLTAGSHAIHAVYTTTGAFAGSASTNRTQTVNKATATITGAALNGSGYYGIYDGAAHAATATVTGVGGVSLGPIVSSTTHTNAGTYSDTVTFVGDANYKAASKVVKSYILKAAATITGDGLNGSGYFGTYDAAAHAATATVTGVGGVVLGPIVSSTTHTNAGTYSDTLTFVGDANYKAASKVVKSYILKAAATITGDALNGSGYYGIYDGAAHVATATVTGVGGVVLGPIVSSTTHTNAGTYSDTLTFVGDANYKAASKVVKSYILKASVTITGNGLNGSGYFGTFDGAAHAATATVTGVGGVILGQVVSSTTHTNVGVYSDTLTFVGDANYKAASKVVKSYIL